MLLGGGGGWVLFQSTRRKLIHVGGIRSKLCLHFKVVAKVDVHNSNMAIIWTPMIE